MVLPRDAMSLACLITPAKEPLGTHGGSFFSMNVLVTVFVRRWTVCVDAVAQAGRTRQAPLST